MDVDDDLDNTSILGPSRNILPRPAPKSMNIRWHLSILRSRSPSRVGRVVLPSPPGGQSAIRGQFYSDRLRGRLVKRIAACRRPCLSKYAFMFARLGYTAP
jgi:hypothetical protein